MSDIFISYARENRERARILAEKLEEFGWSVWWDRNIRTGQHYDEIIERALNDAKCVIVMWSSNSVSSHWVRAEAQEGLDRKILFPIQIENAKIPLAFKNIQTVNLINWNGNSTITAFQNLIQDITSLLGRQSITQKGLGNQTTLKARPIILEEEPFRPSLKQRPLFIPEPELKKPITSELSDSLESSISVSDSLCKVINYAIKNLDNSNKNNISRFQDLFKPFDSDYSLSNSSNDSFEDLLDKWSRLVGEEKVKDIRSGYQQLALNYYKIHSDDLFRMQISGILFKWMIQIQSSNDDMAMSPIRNMR